MAKNLIFMRKILLSLFLLATFALKANTNTFNPPDEGMWLPMFVERLNYVDMAEMGLQLTPDEIYSINNSSLKDAVVGLSGGSTGGFFCTGEIVSDEGLMFTNHHCGYNSINELSTPENNYLEDGFWAYTKEEELPVEGLAASFLIRMDNVTDSIIPFLHDTLSESARSAKVQEISSRLENAASEDGKYNVNVKSFFGGNEYYLFVYETYHDVRFVGAPPSSIGKYGGDTDNWMWPRHTGDFSIFRVYMANDGSPAEYSEDNVPLKPRYHIPISLEGIEDGDFAMIWGFPGGTERYMTSYGIDYTINVFNPTIIDVFGTRLSILKESMDADQKVKLKYASDYASGMNTYKYMIGQTKALKDLNVKGKKEKIEKEFTAWLDKDPEDKEKYGEALDMISKGYEEMKTAAIPFYYNLFIGFRGTEIMQAAMQASRLYRYMNAETKDELEANQPLIDQQIENLKESAKEFYKDYDIYMDMKIFEALLKLYVEKVPKTEWPPYLAELVEDYKGDISELTVNVYEESIFSTREKVEKFLDKPKLKTLEKDPIFQLMMSMRSSFMASQPEYQKIQQAIGKGDRLFIAGLRELYPDKVFYPDANSTMRLTYGSVMDYYPADAVHYNYYTTLKGVMEKEDPNSDEFIVDEKLKELYKKKDYGRYGEDGKLITCFLTTNDITGGNSGSPVFNGNGELIGIAFDGNWEAMSGDIFFENELQRCINVDIRYVLFIIDKFAGAQNLIDELSIAKKKPEPKKITVDREAVMKEE